MLGARYAGHSFELSDFTVGVILVKAGNFEMGSKIFHNRQNVSTLYIALLSSLTLYCLLFVGVE